MNVSRLFVILLSAALVNMLLAVAGTRRFLSLHPAISGAQDLEIFKQMVRRQMYQALLQLCLLGTANLFGLYGLVTRQIGLPVIIGLNGIVIVSSKFLRGIEVRARGLAVADEVLAREYAEICATWVNKALPDF